MVYSNWYLLEQSVVLVKIFQHFWLSSNLEVFKYSNSRLQRELFCSDFTDFCSNFTENVIYLKSSFAIIDVYVISERNGKKQEVEVIDKNLQDIRSSSDEVKELRYNMNYIKYFDYAGNMIIWPNVIIFFISFILAFRRGYILGGAWLDFCVRMLYRIVFVNSLFYKGFYIGLSEVLR